MRTNKIIAVKNGFVLIVADEIEPAEMKSMLKKLSDATGEKWTMVTNTEWRESKELALLDASLADSKARIDSLRAQVEDLQNSLAKLGK